MQPEPPQLCFLRPEIVNLEVQDQLAMLLACHIADAETYRRLEIKHRALSDWIKTGQSLVHRRKVWRV